MSRSPFVSLRHIEEWEWLTCSNDVIKLEFDFDEQNSCWEAVQKGDRVCLRQQNKQLFNDNDEWIIISNGDGSISLKNVISDSYLTQKVISSQGHVIDDTPETWILEVHSLPVLDYGLSDDEVADFILQQCSQIGFFALVNHPLSSHISKLYTAARSSLETSGCQGSKKISLMSPNDFTPPAWWTAPPPQDYYDTCVDVGTRLLNVIFNSLNIKPDPNPIFNLRMMCYSDIGLEEHTDKDWLTILLQDPSLPGLQVEGRDPSNWISVPCTYPVIINIGDAFQSVSGGVLKSKIHRAVPPSDNTRVSFPMFIEPSSWPEVESSSSVITYIVREL